MFIIVFRSLNEFKNLLGKLSIIIGHHLETYKFEKLFKKLLIKMHNNFVYA